MNDTQRYTRLRDAGRRHRDIEAHLQNARRRLRRAYWWNVVALVANLVAMACLLWVVFA